MPPALQEHIDKATTLTARFSDEFLRGWMCAFLDGEGSVRQPRIGRHGMDLTNTDPALIGFCVAVLNRFDIGWRINVTRRDKPNWAQAFHIEINSLANVTKFARLFGAISPKKRKRLADTIRKARKANGREPSPQVLRRWYWQEGLSQLDIAERWWGNRTCPGGRKVGRWLQNFGIPVRTRSEAVTLAKARRRCA